MPQQATTKLRFPSSPRLGLRATPAIKLNSGPEAAGKQLLSSLIALLLVIAGTAAVVYPTLLVALGCLWFGSWIVLRILQSPVRAFTTIMYVLPWPGLFRLVVLTYAPSIPLFLERFWLEVLLSTVCVWVAVRSIVLRRQSAPGASWTWEDTPIHLLMLAAIYGLLITLVQHRYVAAMFGIDVSMSPLLAYYLLRALRVNRSQINHILMAFALGYILLAVPSFYDYFVHPRFLLQINMAMFGLHGDPERIKTWYTTAYFRMLSLMYEEDFWGAISSLVAIYSLVRIFAGRASRIIYVLAAISNLGLVFSMARGAILGWIIGMVTVALIYKGKRIRVVISLLVLAVMMGAIYLQYRSDARVQYIEKRAAAFAPMQAEGSGVQVSSTKGTFDGRTEQWRFGLYLILSQPSGYGLGTDGLAAMYAGVGRVATDGDYPRIGIEQGIFGFVLVMAGMIGIPFTVWRRMRGITDVTTNALGVFLIAQTVSLFVQAVPGDAFEYPYTTPVYFILFAIFMELTTTSRNRPVSAMAEADKQIAARPPVTGIKASGDNLLRRRDA